MPRISDQTAERLLKGLTAAQLRVLDALPENGDHRMLCEVSADPRTLRVLSAAGTPLLKCSRIAGTPVDAKLTSIGMKLKAIRMEQLRAARKPSTKSQGSRLAAVTRKQRRAEGTR